METIEIHTVKRSELIDITADVAKAVHRTKVKDGMALIFCPHTTAGLTINENADPSVKKDILTQLEALVPEAKGYSHSEGNSDSHIKTALLGNSVNVIIKDNNIVLGTWQGIYFCEFDGPREREVWVKAIQG
jgi:secondary thiamine-phosphate synthase enzyme